MFGTRLAVGLVVGAGLFVGTATLRADDTILLKRVKDDATVQNLARDRGDADTLDVRGYGGGWRGGYAGHYGGYRHGGYEGYYGGYRHGYYGSYYRFGYYPRVSVGIYGYPSYYVAPPVYYYPSYYYSYPSYYSSAAYPITQTAAVETPVFRLKLETPAITAEVLPVGAETLAKPRQEQPTERTFPYDGTPQAPVPMPRPDPSLKAKPPADAPDDGRVVKLPASDRFAYPAYGDKPARPAITGDRTVVVKDEVKKPGK